MKSFSSHEFCGCLQIVRYTCDTNILCSNSWRVILRCLVTVGLVNFTFGKLTIVKAELCCCE
jgi:hypothetical protein